MNNNWGFRIFALILALLIWLQIVLGSSHRTVVNFPVALINLSPEVSLSKLPKTVAFDVRGSGIDLLKLHFSSTKIVLDVANLKAGEDKLPLDDYNIKDLPANCNVEILGPAIDNEMAVSTDVLLYKSIKVMPAFENETARLRFAQLDYILNPSSIKIHGPKRELDNLKYISTAPINSAMLDNQDFYVPITFSSSRVSSSVLRIHASRMPQQIQTKVFEAIKIETEGKAIFPKNITIKVEGDPQIINKLKPADLKISIAKEADENNMFELEVDLPKGVNKYELTPTKVSLR